MPPEAAAKGPMRPLKAVGELGLSLPIALYGRLMARARRRWRGCPSAV